VAWLRAFGTAGGVDSAAMLCSANGTAGGVDSAAMLCSANGTAVKQTNGKNFYSIG